MNIKSVSAAALFLAAAMAAHAQTAGLNDIIVGFRDANTGGASNLEVKAGSVTTLAALTTETLIGNYASNLSAITASWQTGTTAALHGLSWGAGGTASSTLIYGTSLWDKNASGTLGVAGSTLGGNVWNAVASVSGGNSKFGSLYTAFNSVSATPVGDGKAKTIAAGNTSSWTALGSTTAAFGVFNPNNNGFAGIEANNLVSGHSYQALDLYSVGVNTSTFLGTFALYAANEGSHLAGDLTFTAIPEPSTYAAILGVVTLGFAAIRRRKQQVDAQV